MWYCRPAWHGASLFACEPTAAVAAHLSDCSTLLYCIQVSCCLLLLCVCHNHYNNMLLFKFLLLQREAERRGAESSRANCCVPA